MLSNLQGSRQCIQVAIVNDNILESNETFSVTLTTTQLGVNSEISEAIVTIIDNEGGSCMHLISRSD